MKGLVWGQVYLFLMLSLACAVYSPVTINLSPASDAAGNLFVALATLVGPLLASCVAAWAALVAFPKQMRAQREVEWHRDKRAKFGEFLSKLEDVLLNNVSTLTNVSPQIVNLNGALGVLEITSTSEETIAAARAVVKQVNEWITDTRPSPDPFKVSILALSTSITSGLTLGGDRRRTRMIKARVELVEKMRAELKETR